MAGERIPFREWADRHQATQHAKALEVWARQAAAPPVRLTHVVPADATPADLEALAAVHPPLRVEVCAVEIDGAELEDACTALRQAIADGATVVLPPGFAVQELAPDAVTPERYAAALRTEKAIEEAALLRPGADNARAREQAWLAVQVAEAEARLEALGLRPVTLPLEGGRWACSIYSDNAMVASCRGATEAEASLLALHNYFKRRKA